MTSTTMNSALISELTQRFPTSESLFAWLRSNEGGRLVIREDWMTPEEPLALIHYSKEKSDLTLPHVGEFRSVVWDVIANRPVCAGPARGLKFTAAVDAGVDPSAPAHAVEDFVDGVMLNLFNYGGRWQLATRTVLGADCNFYGTRTFADLFWETFTLTGLTVGELDPAANYSWVLQHPAERIVVAPQYGIPKLYLVAATGGALSEKLLALIPRAHTDLKTLEDVKQRVVAWGRRFGTTWQGLVVKTPDGKRYKLRSNEYDEARHLRGNQAKRPFIWLERWSEGRLGAYLRLYPEEQHEADAVVGRFKACTQELHDLYQRVYRRKELPLGQAPQKYRKLLWDAHQANAGAYFPHLRDFMNKQDTARKLWLVNYETRYGASGTADPN